MRDNTECKSIEGQPIATEVTKMEHVNASPTDNAARPFEVSSKERKGNFVLDMPIVIGSFGSHAKKACAIELSVLCRLSSSLSLDCPVHRFDHRGACMI